MERYRIGVYYTVETETMEQAVEAARDIKDHLLNTYESEKIVGGPSIAAYSNQGLK